MHVKQTVYVTSLLFTIGLSEYAENVNNSDFEKVFFSLLLFLLYLLSFGEMLSIFRGAFLSKDWKKRTL